MAKGVPWKPNGGKGTSERFVPTSKPESESKGSGMKGQSFSPHLKKGGGKGETPKGFGTANNTENNWRGRSRDTTETVHRDEGCRPNQDAEKSKDTISAENWGEGCHTCRREGLEYMHDWNKCEKNKAAKKGAKGGWKRRSASVGPSRSNWEPTSPWRDQKQ